jgi:hypothetical protein
LWKDKAPTHRVEATQAQEPTLAPAPVESSHPPVALSQEPVVNATLP